jgi:putative membrane protein
VTSPCSSPVAGERGSRHSGQGVLVLLRVLVRWVLLAAVLALVAWLVPSMDINGGVWGLLVTAVVFGLVNAVLGPLLHLLALPLTLMTLGLFSLVVNGVLLAIAAGITDYLDVGGFLATILAALLLSVLNAVAYFVTGSLAARREMSAAAT